MAGETKNFSRPFLTFRTDKNQKSIVKTLRKLGFVVHSTHNAGKGFLDLVVEKHGLNVLVEVKDGSKSFSQRQFTPDQRKFFFNWRGLKCVVINDDDCLKLNRQIDELGHAINAAGIKLHVMACEDAIYKQLITF